MYQFGIQWKILLIISGWGFRENQQEYVERADQREQNTVQRGKKKPYTVIPMGEDDLYINVAILKPITESLSQIESGETKRISSSEEVDGLLGL